jgi:uncharacterized protein YcbK (DUF882 family)
VLGVLSALLLASCTSTSDPLLQLGLAPQNPSLAAAEAPDAQGADQAASTGAEPGYFIVADDDPVLPDQVAEVPTLQSPPLALAMAPKGDRPAAEALTQAEIETVVQTRMGPAGPELENVATAQSVVAEPAAPAPAPVPAKKRGFFASLFGSHAARTVPAPVVAPQQPVVAAAATSPEPEPEPQVAAFAEPVPSEPAAIAHNAAVATTFIENRPPQVAAASFAAPKKRSFFASLFSPAQAAPSPLPPAAAEPAAVTLASAEPVDAATQPRAYLSGGALPGVRTDNLYEITRKSGTGDDSDIDLHEDDEVQVASAAGLARLAPNGLIKQTDRVDVGCLKPSLVRVLKAVESHYGRSVVVTSGYRNPPANRRARGARNSLHMYCAAADIQVPGVSKLDLANYARSMPGRGGVGTYCHTDSVHVDVGPERDWNWRCRRRK